MLTRHALLSLAVVLTGLVAGGASVLADEGEHRQELHIVRGPDPVVIDRRKTLHRLDSLLEGIEEIAALTPTHPGRGHAHGRTLRDDRGDRERHSEDPDDPDDRDDRDDRDDHRERPGARPVERVVLHRLPPPQSGRVVEERLDAMRREILVLRRTVLRAPDVERPRPRVVLPMDERAFAVFIRDVRRTAFARDKVQVVRDVAPHTHFTSDQVAIIVRAIEPWGQVDAAVLLHPRVLDLQSFHVAINAMTFRSDRAEVRRIIRR